MFLQRGGIYKGRDPFLISLFFLLINSVMNILAQSTNYGTQLPYNNKKNKDDKLT